jgi:hypothetical protein
MTSELQVSNIFVNDFFLEVLRQKKHLKHHNEILEEENKKKLHELKDDVISLEDEAEQIQALDEKTSEQLPTPTLAPQKTIQTIALPPPPLYRRSVPQLPQKLPEKKLDFPDLGDFGKMLLDPEITLIQCDGAETPIKVNKKNKSIKTKLHLTEEEIRVIIKKFSDNAKVPMTEPVFKAEMSRFAITAVLPHFSSPKFIIIKK